MKIDNIGEAKAELSFRGEDATFHASLSLDFIIPHMERGDARRLILSILAARQVLHPRDEKHVKAVVPIDALEEIAQHIGEKAEKLKGEAAKPFSYLHGRYVDFLTQSDHKAE